MRLALHWSIVCSVFCTTMLAGQENDPAKHQGSDANDAKSLLYRLAESPLIYGVELTADFGEARYDVAYKGTLSYRLKPRRDGDLTIECEGELASSPTTGYQSRHDFFRLGPIYQTTRYRFDARCSIKPNGDPIEVSRPNWLFGLPFDFGRLPFPELRESEEWDVTDSVTLVRSLISPDHVQLLPISPAIKPDPQRAHYARLRSEPDSKKVTLATSQRKRVQQSADSATIEETYSLQGTDFQPMITITGTGTVVFSRQRGSIDSLARELRITLKEANRVMTVPVTIRLSRLADEALAKYHADQQAARELAQKRSDQRDAMERQIPEVDDRVAVIAMLEGSNREHLDLLIRKLYTERVEDDPELARLIYAQFFQSRSMGAFAKTVITRLDPTMEQTASLAEKYNGSFDIVLTGEAITADAELKRNQIVCYPYYSSWKAARFYGAVDEVIVVETLERDPKLLALKRGDCRLPTPAFIDPNTVTSE